MGDLEDYGIDIETLRRMYNEYESGVPKSQLERRYLGKPESHGKVFSALVRKYLGVETEKRSTLAVENARLKRLLRSLGVTDFDTEPRKHPTQSGHRPDSSFNFYGYVDIEPADSRQVLRRVLDEIVAPIEGARGECSLTLEVRGRIANDFDDTVLASVRAAMFDLGFATFEVDLGANR
jgi:hypothetical protein